MPPSPPSYRSTSPMPNHFAYQNNHHHHLQNHTAPQKPVISINSAKVIPNRHIINTANNHVMPSAKHQPVSFSGLAEPCASGSTVEIVINAQGNADRRIVVEAISPKGQVLKCPVIQRGTSLTATFTPIEVGDWQISIYYDSEHIKGSPFSCSVYDANLVQVYGLDVGLVGQQLNFNVDAGQAGRGQLKVNAIYNSKSIPVNMETLASGQYKIQFTPMGAGTYNIHIYLNSMEVRGSPFILDIVDASSVSVFGDKLKMASVDRLNTFMIHAVGADTKDITVNITGNND